MTITETKQDLPITYYSAHIPTHVAIIMDGNGRWATMRGLDRAEGHRAGTENIGRVIGAFVQQGVKYLTIFAFSTENWYRPSSEVEALMSIICEVISPESERLHALGVRIRHIGSLEGLPPLIKIGFENSIELTKNNEVLTLCIAFNYGSRLEILNAVKRMIADGINTNDIDEEIFSEYLYSSGIPDPDLIIRSAGEMRLSNFLLWQAAYSEFYSTPVLWPDFDENEVEKAIHAYSMRKRRFGRLDEKNNSQ